MKFGSQIQDRSVPEWRLNNIDYKGLKEAVKKVTTFRPDKDISGSWETDKELQWLRKAFLQQFRNINAFVSLKIKEASTRLVSVQSSIVRLQRTAGGPTKRNLHRQMGLIHLHLNSSNTELLRICRFLILQKIALRKLFKKFLKYYPYDHGRAQDFVQALKSCPDLTEGEDGISFTTIDLDPYLLEISLIVDVMRELEQARKPSETDREDVQTGSQEFISQTAAPKPYSQAVFDASFLGKATRLQSLLISEESISQAKFLLLQLGFHVVDDDMITASQQSVQNANPTNLASLAASGKSPRSFQDLRAALEPDQSNTPFSALTEIKSSETVSIILFDREPIPKFLEDDAANQYPNIAIKEEGEDNCTLMCHVGGLRNYVISDKVPYKAFQEALYSHQATNSQELSATLSPKNKLCLDWLKSHSMDFCKPEIITKRTRFIKPPVDGEEIEYLVCVDEEILLNGSQNVPHALLEIRRLSPRKVFDKKPKSDKFIMSLICKLLDFNIHCYPLAKDLTLWKLLYSIQESNSTESTLLSTICRSTDSPTRDSFFTDGAVELSTMISMKEGNKPALSHKKIANARRKSRSSSPDSTPRKIRYWNEFDDGDEADQNADCFYLDQEANVNDDGARGFISLNRSVVNAVYDFSENLRRVLVCAQVIPEERPLLADSLRGPSLGSVTTFGTMDTSQSAKRDFDRYMGYSARQDEGDYAYALKHDHVVTLFYMTSLLISCITSGISLGIVVSIFRELNDDDIVLGPSTGVASVIIMSLLFSLLLSCISLLLLFTRLHMAPWWHYVSCSFIFLIVACTVCYGLIEIFL
ncbi:LAME_0G09670g1_1 [Lachancea meyersii CBS 8951]|uniref:LAME_0G09670g1_1 n=1 Tax=Lachancea meyersii CBS 8951 TaxID=1266667 RepID=A0A1G4K8S9_9SACH|nr:LAME_0G09670g1_1 [Lachancea meyersii CBS 8951]